MKPQGYPPQRPRHSSVSSPHSLQGFVKMITQHGLVINIPDKFEVAIGEKVELGTVAGEEAGDGRFLQIVDTDLGTSATSGDRRRHRVAVGEV
jgi:hypothetical protein